MIIRRVIIAVSVLGIFVILLGAGGWFAAQNMDLKPVLARYLSTTYGRPVTIDGFTFTWSNPMHIDIENVRFSNAPWGSSPDMIRCDHLTVDFNPWNLLKGQPQLDAVTLDGLRIVLERDPQGLGNWKTHGATTPVDQNAQSSAKNHDQRQRSELPVILNLAMRNSLITFRTSSYALLKIGFKDLVLKTDEADQPIHLNVDGSYNDAPVRLVVTGNSFDDLHETDKPFHADILATGPSTVIKLNADMMDPLNFEGVTGKLDLDVKKLGDLVRLFGSDTHSTLPLQLDGILKHDGDDWHIDHTRGKVVNSRFDGELELIEGARLKPDNAKLDLAFDHIDVDRLLRGQHGQSSPQGSLPEIDDKPGILLDAKLAAKKLIDHTVRISDLKLHAYLLPAIIKINDMAFSYLGGGIKGEVIAKRIKSGDQIDAHISVTDLDSAQLLKMAGIKSQIMLGGINTHIEVSGQGRTTSDLQKTLDGHIVTSLVGGQISQKDMLLASGDLRSIFDGGDNEMAELYCVLAVGNIHAGQIILTPLRLKTSEGELFGGGTIDLARQTLDISFKTERKTTGFLALDLPIRLTGSFDNIHAVPHIQSSIKDLKAQAPQNIGQLPVDMQALVHNSLCAQD